jgi:hypothetical protein
MARVTDAQLEQVIKLINSGLDEPDRIMLRSGYGFVGIADEAHDSVDISQLMTKGELMNWLRGFQQGMYYRRRSYERGYNPS